MPTPREVRDYLDRSGDKAFAWDLPIAEGRDWWFTYFTHDNTAEDSFDFVIFQAYGDHRQIAKAARERAKWLDCDRIIFGTSRNGFALARLCNGEVVAYIIELPIDED